MSNYLKRMAGKVSFIALLVTAVACNAERAAVSENSDEDVAAIKVMLDSAYLKGFYHDLDPGKVKVGFHPDMNLTVFAEGQVMYVPLEGWMAHEAVGADKTSLTPEQKAKSNATLTVDNVRVVGNAAAVEARVHIDNKLVYTNFYGLHKVDGKWLVVTKLFNDHAH